MFSMYGIFGNYLLNTEMRSISGIVRGLPPIPHGYTLWNCQQRKRNKRGISYRSR